MSYEYEEAMGTNGGQVAVLSPVALRAMRIARGMQRVEAERMSDSAKAALIGIGVIILGGAVFGTVALVKKLRS
jgi:hypothetical protein